MWLHFVTITTIFIVGYIIFTYNYLATLVDLNQKARSDVNAQLKLCTDLVETIHKHMADKQNSMEKTAELQESLAEIEGQIQLARHHYNSTCSDLNMAIESFPSNFIAYSFRFTKVTYLEVN